VGQKKLQEFGDLFMGEIAEHLLSNARQIFADDSFTTPPARAPRMNETTRETLRHFRAGRTVEQIAQARMLATGTIYSHLASAVEAGEAIDLNQFLSANEQKAIRDAFKQFGYGNLSGVQEALGGKFEFGLLRLFRSVEQRGG
jgi:ATP-dependent DNA helicase RecQ